jgi:hypothetical protein
MATYIMHKTFWLTSGGVVLTERYITSNNLLRQDTRATSATTASARAVAPHCADLPHVLPHLTPHRGSR